VQSNAHLDVGLMENISSLQYQLEVVSKVLLAREFFTIEVDPKQLLVFDKLHESREKLTLCVGVLADRAKATRSSASPQGNP
jgi:hypothetical protein